MKSFDVFDTLIARRFISNDIVLASIGESLNIPNFVQARKLADNNSRSLLEIYQQLVAAQVISAEQMPAVMQQEIALEIATTYPIQDNMSRVEDGDLLITDMYLPASVILQMVRAAGLTKQVTIYQSNAGKSSGSIWKALADSNIEVHLGDNQHSDFNVPKAAGVNAELAPATGLTQIEQFLSNNKLPHIALLVREIRHRNNISLFKEFSEVATQINIPWLFLAAEMLRRKYPTREIVFLGRDCQLLQRLYTEYFALCYYMPFSRNVAFTDPTLAVEYITAHAPKRSILVDVNSTGNTWQHINSVAPIEMEAIIYSDVDYYTSVKPTVPQTFSWLTTKSEIGQANYHYTEVINCGDHGHLDTITKLADGVFITTYGTPELDQALVAACHTPVTTAVQLSAFYKQGIRNDLASLDVSVVKQLFGTLTIAMCNQPQLNDGITASLEKERQYSKKFTK